MVVKVLTGMGVLGPIRVTPGQLASVISKVRFYDVHAFQQRTTIFTVLPLKEKEIVFNDF